MKSKLDLFRKPFFYVSTFVLWILTSFLAIWEILIVRSMVVRVLTKLLMDRAGLSQIMATVWAYRAGVVTALLMTIIAIIIVLGGADFRYDPNKKRQSWKQLLWILVFQIAVLGFSFIW